jgi:hypothetical protein
MEIKEILFVFGGGLFLGLHYGYMLGRYGMGRDV